MPHIRPFAAIRYASKPGVDLSRLIAPPYDVLDEVSKTELQARDPHNIVSVDLPHLPPKTVGPDAIYARAAVTLEAWLHAGVLKRDRRPALYPYTQTYDHHGITHHRRGYFGLVRLSPFGQGQVIPHEKTYASAIEDRLKLMRNTRVQLSPIFGLFSDPKNEVTNLLYHNLARPEMSAELDGVRNDLWSVIDAEAENKVIDLMGTRPIYIADGHHRYTTALAYQAELEKAHGGPLPPTHPANYCLFNLVSLQDPGLVVLPTHRLLGGIAGFEIEGLKLALAPHFTVEESTMHASEMASFGQDWLKTQPPHTFGLFDGATHMLYVLRLKNADLLAEFEPGESTTWHHLDVAILQRFLIDEIFQKAFSATGEITRGYTADASTIPTQVDGKKYQLAVLLQPTPLTALEELGKQGGLMPQKSTYFFPKLATGLVINPLS